MCGRGYFRIQKKKSCGFKIKYPDTCGRGLSESLLRNLIYKLMSVLRDLQGLRSIVKVVKVCKGLTLATAFGVMCVNRGVSFVCIPARSSSQVVLSMSAS